MATSERSSRTSYVRSFARGLSVIRSFSANSPLQNASQVAKMAGLDRAGARRLLHTLETLGYARREGSKFCLTPHILDLAYVYLSTTRLWGTVEPVMQRLVGAVQESSSVTVLDGTEIVHVAGIPGPRLMTTHSAIGTRFPAYCTSTGRVLLGGLSKHDLDRTLKMSNLTKRTKYSVTSIPELKRIIRRDHERGWSLLNQEVEEGLCGLAVPIFGRPGQIVAAIAVIGNASRSTPRTMTSAILPRLKRAAQEISTLLSTQPPLADQSSVFPSLNAGARQNNNHRLASFGDE